MIRRVLLLIYLSKSALITYAQMQTVIAQLSRSECAYEQEGKSHNSICEQITTLWFSNVKSSQEKQILS